jgi:hypothetical protein
MEPLNIRRVDRASTHAGGVCSRHLVLRQRSRGRLAVKPSTGFGLPIPLDDATPLVAIRPEM